MSDANNRMLRLQSQLEAERQKGKKDIIKQMTPEQAEFVRDVLHYGVHPYLYKIWTKRIANASSAMWLLKEIHRAHKKGRRVIYKTFRVKEARALECEGIDFKPVKYRVVFNAK